MEINYKGYVAKVFFSAEVDSFYGEVTNANDVIVFQAETMQSAIQAMQTAVENYLTLIDVFPVQDIPVQGFPLQDIPVRGTPVKNIPIQDILKRKAVLQEVSL